MQHGGHVDSGVFALCLKPAVSDLRALKPRLRALLTPFVRDILTKMVTHRVALGLTGGSIIMLLLRRLPRLENMRVESVTSKVDAQIVLVPRLGSFSSDFQA